MWYQRLTVWSLVAVVATSISAQARSYTDPFDGNDIDDMWTFRSKDGNDNYTVKGGMFTFDILANQDQFRQGIDLAPFLLMDAPDSADFTIETKVSPVLDQAVQPQNSHTGLIIFREDNWSISLFGPYNNLDVRLEDVIGADYRWR
ncbi:MAG: hypothetical protein O3A46_14475, partial [Candidatus Poribacteria bacterium]|nr:hypothetical protein [Candidatus Poribacteria bacterium]